MKKNLKSVVFASERFLIRDPELLTSIPDKSNQFTLLLSFSEKFQGNCSCERTKQKEKHSFKHNSTSLVSYL